MMNIRNVGSKESAGVKFEEGTCTELCLELWFQGAWSQDGFESDCPERKS